MAGMNTRTSNGEVVVPSSIYLKETVNQHWLSRMTNIELTRQC